MRRQIAIAASHERVIAQRSAVVIAAAIALAACTSEEHALPSVAGGDAQQGRAVLDRYECGVCHIIPGIPAAMGQVGPSLEDYARRPYLAGKFPNEPDALVRWILDAPSMAPQTAMPAVPMSPQEARDAAAYLYQLE